MTAFLVVADVCKLFHVSIMTFIFIEHVGVRAMGYGTHMWWELRRSSSKVLHFLSQAFPRHGALEADAHVAGCSDYEGDLEGLHFDVFFILIFGYVLCW